MNSLEQIREAYQVQRDLIRIVRREIVTNNETMLHDTNFSGMTESQAFEAITALEEELDALFVLGYFIRFERQIKDHLIQTLDNLRRSTSVPPELAENFSKFLEKESDWWKMDDLPRLFSPPADETAKSEVGTIRAFRNKIAHGKPPAHTVPPEFAYGCLVRFLQISGIL